MIERDHTEVDGDTPICVVTGHAQPTPASMTQANVNTISSARHRDMLESTAGIPTSSQLVDVDGVVTIDAIYNGPTYRHIRLFYLGDGVTLTQILIDCSVDGPVSSDVSSNIGALIGTLRIGTR